MSVGKTVRHDRAILSALFALSVLSGFADAQTVPEPDAFEQDLLSQRSYFEYGGFEPNLDELFPMGVVSRWSLSAGIAGDYTDNVDHTPRGHEAFSTDGQLDLGWIRQSPRLTGTANYALSSSLYASDAVEDRNGTRQAAAGALKWQAGQYLRLDGSGYLTQNVERGLSRDLPGVSTSYRNREDQYGLRGTALWQFSRGSSNQTSYAFSYRNYLSDDADGSDTRTHRADTRFKWQLGGRDTMAMGYAYSRADEVEESTQRQNHVGTASWSHAFPGGVAGGKSASVILSYSADRGLQDTAANYWYHKGDLAYAIALSPRSDAEVGGGYRWLRSADGDTHEGWGYSARLGHRFSEHVRCKLAVRQDWDYEPASSRTDFTQLTKIWEVQGGLDSTLSRTLNGRLLGFYLNAEGTEDLDIGTTEVYWEAGGEASLSGRLSENGFWGVGYRLNRYQTDLSDDDYFLQAGNLFFRQRLLSWLSGRISYSHERRNYDVTSRFDEYHENRLIASLSVFI